MNSIEKSEEVASEYKELLKQVLTEKEKEICSIVGGPEKKGNLTYYRVSSDGSERLVTLALKENLLFSSKKKLEIGTEVVVIGSTIVSILPESLERKREIPKFNPITWDEIGGLGSQISRIREAVEIPLANKKLAEEMGLSPIKGILLYGPPGCGKTLIAKAIVSQVLCSTEVEDGAFVYVKGAELLSMYVGQTEANIKSIFSRCRLYRERTGNQSVLFIDEADALLPIRGSRRSSDVDRTIVPTFLSEMDGFEGNNPLVILSTNLPNSIDEAVLREGRIDIKIEIDRPNKKDSEEIFLIHLNKVKCAENPVELAKKASEVLFASKCCDISGAKIANIVQASTRIAFMRVVNNPKSKKGVSHADIQEAIKK